GSVLDPACGVGTLLRSAAGAGATATYGQDIDEAVARVAGLWLELHDRPGEVRVGDSLRHDAYAGEYFDAVVCSPPFGVTNWGQEELGYDRRFEYGVPPRTEPELAWVQHAVAHLRPGGRAVLLMPPAAASRRAGRRIRAELLRRGVLRAVIALPARAAAPHGVPLHLWVLRKPDSPTPPGDVLLVDVSTTAGGEVDRAFARALASLRGDDREGIARAVPVIELLDDEVDLNPVRRSWPPVGGTDPGHRLNDVQAQLAALLARLPGLIPDFKPSSGTATTPTLSVADLTRSGALTILGPARPGSTRPASTRSGSARSGSTRAGSSDKPTAGRVLTAQDVVEDRDPSGGPDEPVAPEILVRAGDVVVPVVAHRLTARVVATDGVVLGRNLYVLRPDPEVLDPWFLAGQLRTSMNERQASSLSGVLRFDVRRAQVARLPLSEQRRYAEAYRRLDDFDRAMRRAGALGDELVQLAADGLARGVLSPESGTEPPRKARTKRPS
ncbi:MAG TPA: N-6 DNA methylase, partial [Micromonosporaceae bacterium]|nr:N-6 DNA methylase [Micromonosporaceae bacterium]